MGSNTSTDQHFSHHQNAVLCPETYMNAQKQCVKTPPGAQCLNIGTTSSVTNYLALQNGQVVKDASGNPQIRNSTYNVNETLILPGDGTIGYFDQNKPCQLN